MKWINIYHPALELTIRVWRRVRLSLVSHFRPQQQGISPDWNWRKALYQALYAALAKIYWADLFEIHDAYRTVELFIIIMVLMSRLYP